jgi:hypothetical protein
MSSLGSLPSSDAFSQEFKQCTTPNDGSAEILLKKSVEMAFWDRWLAEAPAFYAAAGLSFASLRGF